MNQSSIYSKRSIPFAILNASEISLVYIKAIHMFPITNSQFYRSALNTYSQTLPITRIRSLNILPERAKLVPNLAYQSTNNTYHHNGSRTQYEGSSEYHSQKVRWTSIGSDNIWQLPQDTKLLSERTWNTFGLQERIYTILTYLAHPQQIQWTFQVTHNHRLNIAPKPIKVITYFA